MATATATRKPARKSAARPKVSAAEQARRAEAREARVEAAHELLTQGIATLTQAEGWRAYLAASRRFRTYSLRNQILIWIQCPDATRVAGYKAWLALGYQVRAGEKSITIFAPLLRKVTEEEAREVGATPDQCQTKVMGFTTAAVFDRSQVEPIEGKAQPLDDPAFELTDGEAPVGMLATLVALIEAEGFSYSEQTPDTPGAYGTTNYTTVQVRVRPDLTEGQKAYVAAHELGHILCGHEHTDDPRSRREVEAESVAFLVAGDQGLDTSSSSFGYIAGWAEEDVHAALSETATKVREVAGKILTAFES